MSLILTQLAQAAQTGAANILGRVDPHQSTDTQVAQLHTVLDMTLQALQSLIWSVQEDQQQSGQVLPVRPVPTGGRRGRP